MGTRKNQTGTAWAEISADLAQHPKVRAMQDDLRAGAVGFFCVACAFCQQQRNDGVIYCEQLPAILKCSEDERRRLVGELVRVGLFDVLQDGYAVHDYLDHNKSADEIAAHSEEQAKNGRKGGIASGKSRSNRLKQPLEAVREAQIRAERREENGLDQQSRELPCVSVPAGDEPW